MIPKVIHYCWIGGNPLPKSAVKCIESWKKYCPDYEIIEWNESNYDFAQNAFMREAYEAKKWGFVPDYARLDIIYRHGGIYLDVDVEIVRSFDSLLDSKGFAGYQNETEVALGLGFGAEKGNPVIKHLLDSYDGMHFVNEDGSLNLTASPLPNSISLAEIGLRRDGSLQEIDGFIFYPIDYFCPKSLNDGVVRLTDNSYSIHQFDGSWLSDESKLAQQERWTRGKKREKKHRRRERRTAFFEKIIGKDRFYRLKVKLGMIKQ